MSECIGQTRVELEAMIVAFAASWNKPVDTDKLIANMLELGQIKHCSVHPDKYISTMWRKRAVPRRSTATS